MNTKPLKQICFSMLCLVLLLGSAGSRQASALTALAPIGGSWSGTTSRGLPMSFNTSSTDSQWTTFKLKTDFIATTCYNTSVVLEITVPGPGSITSNQFNYTSSTYSFTGTFSSNNNAFGTYSFTNRQIVIGLPFPPYVCYYYLTQSGTWTASIPLPPTEKSVFSSIAIQDGWVLESAENSNQGGKMNSSGNTMSVGDDKANRQYVAIISFDTSPLPDQAVITKATLKVKQQSSAGSDPVGALDGFMVDIKRGTFGTPQLAINDFKTKANKVLGPFNPALSNDWYVFNLTAARASINKLATNSGLTQIRIRFKLDDNNDALANIIKLYSGNAGATSRPRLTVEYYVP